MLTLNKAQWLTLAGFAAGVIGAGSYSTDTHAITDSYNPVDNSQQPIDNSNQGNPVYTPEPIPE